MPQKYVKTKDVLAAGSVDNLVAVYEAADQETREAGARWYDDAYRELTRYCSEYPLSMRQVAAITAVLSPSLSWEFNLRAVATVLAGGKPTGYGANVEKARRVLAGEDPNAVVSGDKVRAFYENLLDWRIAPTAVVDRHMIRAWLALHDQRGGFTCGPGMMKKAAADIAAAAKQVGLPFPQFQAIVWMQTRPDTTEDATLPQED
jgi:hypothetical protein